MADVAVVSAVIKKTVDICANLIVQESSQLYGMPVDIRWLEDQMRHMQSYLEDADNKQLTNPKVRSLLKEIKELAEDVEDILDTFLPKIESHRSRGFLKKTAHILPYWYTCYKFTKEIEKIKRGVQSIDVNRRTYGVNEDNSGRVSEVVPTPRNIPVYNDENIVIGFDKDIDELKNKLLSKQEKRLVVSIVGMPGLGKTTLAKKVFESVRNDFECSASVSISQEPNIKVILGEVANQVGLPKEEREENLEANLYAFLQEKRYVLFLDDIWRTQTWDELKKGFPIDFNGDSRIIITSRQTNVGRYIGGENSLHQLQPLNFQTSWELFSKLIEPWERTSQGFKNSELENIGKMIVEKCGGMPLAIVVTVGMLRERKMSEIEWHIVLNNMGQDAHDKCSTILATSYKDLPIALKPCFLYLGLFPEDYEIKTSSLIRMWMAENFISGIGNREAEDVGEDCINKLVVRNLVEAVSRSYDGRIKSIRIHDLLHSFCINLAKETNFFHTTLNQLGTSSSTVVGRIRRLSIHHQNNYLNTSTPKLRALFIFEEISPEILTFSFLRVLSLRFSRCNIFLEHIVNLSQLRCLQLELFGLEYYALPLSICNLKNLETLDVRGVYSLEVPFGIWKMKKLRHLNFHSSWLGNVSPIMSQLLLSVRQKIEVLPNLQSLVVGGFSNMDTIWFLKFPNLRKLALLGVKAEVFEVICGSEQILKKVEYLELWILGGVRAINLMNLSQYDKLLKLKLRFRNLDELPESYKFPPNLIKLTLVGIKLKEDSMKVLKELPKLRILKLGSNSYVGTTLTLDCSGVGSFPQLEILQLEDLYFLEKLIVDEHETGGGGMPKLRRVIIKGCPRLRTIPDSLQQKVTIIRN